MQTTVDMKTLMQHDAAIDVGRSRSLGVQHACGHTAAYLLPFDVTEPAAFMLAAELFATRPCPVCASGVVTWSVDAVAGHRAAPVADPC